MRHQRSGKKLGRDSAHRRALYANLAGALIEHGRIKTTVTKAKAVKPIAEQMITLGRRGDIHARRQAVAFLRSKDVVHKLFDEVGPALRGAARRLLADRPARAAPGRRRRDGLPRARRHAARAQVEDEPARTSEPVEAACRDGSCRDRRRGRERRTTSREAAEPRRRSRTRRASPTTRPSESDDEDGCAPSRTPEAEAAAADADEAAPPRRTCSGASGGCAERGADRDDHHARERDGGERGRRSSC